MLPQRDALRDVAVLVAREAPALATGRLEAQVLLPLPLALRAQPLARLRPLRVAAILVPVAAVAPAAAAAPNRVAQEICGRRAGPAAHRLVAVELLIQVSSGAPCRKGRRGPRGRRAAVQLHDARALHARPGCERAQLLLLGLLVLH